LQEQICVAALETNNMPLAEQTLKILHRQFPKSSRVGRLEGMLLEAKGQFDEALLHYDNLIKNDVANLPIRKRKVSSICLWVLWES
jgi:Flp pilus assembly protein TadD